MTIQTKAPDIRFENFSGDWQDKGIGSILAETRRPVELLDNELYQLVTVKRRNEGVVARASLKGKDILVKNYFGIKSGDYLISKRQVVHGANGIVPESLDNAVVSNEYLVVTDSDEITAKFWTVISKRHQMHKLFFISSYGVDIEKLVFDVTDWKSRVITIPDVTEQSAITDYFRQLDRLINQHQQKHDKLSNIKKAMLEKMFPKQGETIPEIRFKGFSGEWADSTLSDVIDVRSGKDYKYLSKGNIPVYGTGGYMLSVDSALSDDEDAIGIGRKGTIDKPYLLRAPFWTVDTLFYAVPKPKFKLDYLYCLFQKINWKKYDESTGVPSLSKVAINNIPVRVTSEKEQTAIGNYFQKLDALISQHQQQIIKLNNIKQACLSKMFV